MANLVTQRRAVGQAPFNPTQQQTLQQRSPFRMFQSPQPVPQNVFAQGQSNRKETLTKKIFRYLNKPLASEVGIVTQSIRDARERAAGKIGTGELLKRGLKGQMGYGLGPVGSLFLSKAAKEGRKKDLTFGDIPAEYFQREKGSGVTAHNLYKQGKITKEEFLKRTGGSGVMPYGPAALRVLFSPTGLATKAGRTELKESLLTPSVDIAGSIATDPLTYGGVGTLIRAAKGSKIPKLAANALHITDNATWSPYVADFADAIRRAPGVAAVTKQFKKLEPQRVRDVVIKLSGGDDVVRNLADEDVAKIGSALVGKTKNVPLELQPVVKSIDIDLYRKGREVIKNTPELAKSANVGTVYTYNLSKGVKNDLLSDIYENVVGGTQTPEVTAKVAGLMKDATKGANTIDDVLAAMFDSVDNAGSIVKDPVMLKRAIAKTGNEFIESAASTGLKQVARPSFIEPALYLESGIGRRTLQSAIRESDTIQTVANAFKTAPNKALKGLFKQQQFDFYRSAPDAIKTSKQILGTLSPDQLKEYQLVAGGFKSIDEADPVVRSALNTIDLKFLPFNKAIPALNVVEPGVRQSSKAVYSVSEPLAKKLLDDISRQALHVKGGAAASDATVESLKKFIDSRVVYKTGESADDFATSVRKVLSEAAGKGFNIADDTADVAIGNWVTEVGTLAKDPDIAKAAGIVKIGDRPTYFGPALYKGKEFGEAAKQTLGGADTMVGGRARARADYTLKTIDEQFGGFVDPRYSVAKGLMQEGKTAARQTYFSTIADNFAYSQNVGGRLRQVTGKTFGNLDGKWVDPEVYHHLQNFATAVTKPQSRTGKGFAWALSRWKEGKTVLNPAQQVRNFISDFILNNMVDPASITRYPTAVAGKLASSKLGQKIVSNTDDTGRITGALRNYLRKSGKYYDEAADAGLFGHTFGADEIYDSLGVNKLADMLDLEDIGKVGIYKRAVKGMGAAQGTVEDVAKLQQFSYQRSIGKSIKEAKEFADKAIFNYADLTPFEMRYMRQWVPFYTFSRKSLPLITKTLLDNPSRITAFGRIEKAVEAQSQAPDEHNMPDWMRDMVRLPIKDRFDNYKYLNLKFIYPWGSFFDESNPLPGGISFNPVGTEAVQQVFNKDLYFGSEIVKPGQTGGEAAKARAAHAARTFLPALYTTATGKVIPYAQQKMAGQNPVDYQGRPVTPGQIFLGDILGIKTYPFDPAKAKKSEQYKVNQEIQDVQSLIKQAKNNQSLTPVQRDKKIEKYQERIKKLKQELRKK